MKSIKMLTIVMIIALVNVTQGMDKEQSLEERVLILEQTVQAMQKVIRDQTHTIQFLYKREFEGNKEKKEELAATIAMLEEAKKLNGNG